MSRQLLTSLCNSFTSRPLSRLSSVVDFALPKHTTARDDHSELPAVSFRVKHCQGSTLEANNEMDFASTVLAAIL